MKIKGKIALWFRVLVLLINGMFIYEMAASAVAESIVPFILLFIALLLIDLIYLPIMIHNYVLIYAGCLTVIFGIGRDSINIRDITDIRRTHNPIASTAASLDRLIIKSKHKELICSATDRDLLYYELLKINPMISIHQNKK